MRLPSLLLLAAVLAGCPSPSYDFPYNKEPDPRDKEITLGVGDVIAINVWENRDLTTEATIRPDGTITMPLVGDLKAGGETPSTLKVLIKTRLQDFVKLQGTEITVALRAWRSYRFTLQGEVQREGVYTADGFVTVAQALAMAGGVSRFAKRDEIVLNRVDPRTKQVKKIPISYDLVASGKRPDMNIYVLSGDTIYVP